MKKFTILIVALLVVAMGFAQVAPYRTIKPQAQKAKVFTPKRANVNVAKQQRANTIIFEDGFEGETLTGWTTIDNDGDNNNWRIVRGLPHS